MQWIWRQDAPVSFQAAPLILESESTGILSRGIYKPPWIVPAWIRWRAGIYHLELLNPGQPSYTEQDSMGGILLFKHFLATSFTRTKKQKNWAKQDGLDMSRFKIVKFYTFEIHRKSTIRFRLIKELTSKKWYYAMAAFPSNQWGLAMMHLCGQETDFKKTHSLLQVSSSDQLFTNP